MTTASASPIALRQRRYQVVALVGVGVRIGSGHGLCLPAVAVKPLFAQIVQEDKKYEYRLDLDYVAYLQLASTTQGFLVCNKVDLLM